MNLSKLSDLTPLVINTTNLTESENIVPNLISSTDTASQGYFGLGVMLVVFIVLVYTLFRQDGDIRMDIIRSVLFASGFTSVVGLILLVTGLSSSFVHLMWFLSIFIITLIIVLNLKRKGL